MIKVLHVDDNADDRELTRLNIQRLSKDVEIVGVESAQEAIEYLQNHEVDCIISDFQMPSMDGLELLESLQAENNDTPFIFLTGQGNENVAVEAFRQGVHDYFTKSHEFVHYQRLVNTVFRVVESFEFARVKKESEEKQLRSENRLKKAEEIAQLGSWEIDYANSRLIWSDQTFRIFNLEPHEFPGTFEIFLSAIHPDDRELLGSVFRKTLETGDSFSIKHRILLKSGEEKKVHTQGFTEFSEDGKPLRTFGTVQDITEPERIKAELEESEERYRAIVEHVSDPIFISVQDHIVFANNAALKMLGYSIEELSNCKAVDLVHEDDRDLIIARTKERLDGDFKETTLEYRIISKSGEIKRVEVRSRIIRYRDKRAILAVARDITQRRSLEEKLLREREFTDIVIKSMPGVFYVFDEDGRYVRWNDLQLQITGYTEEEMRELHPLELFEKDQQEDVASVIHEAFKTGSGILIADMKTKDGSNIPFYFTGQRFEMDGKRYLVGEGIPLQELLKHMK